MAEQVELDTVTYNLAARLYRSLRHTLINRGLCQALQDGGLREVEWRLCQVWPVERAMAFVVDTETLPVSLEKLADPDVAHQLSSALGGRRVKAVNHRGLAYVIGLDLPELEAPGPRRALPKRVDLDLGQRPAGEWMVGLRQGLDGPVWLSLERACHIIVGGSSDSGKSAFLRTLLYQLLAMPDEVEVVLCDLEGRTFSAFEGLPRLRFPVAGDVAAATELTAWLLDEMERRGRLFDATGQHPEKLAEYHAVPGMERLPWIVAVFDEFTALLDEAGQRSELYRNVGQLSMRSRKYGMTLVFAGQDFKSDLVNSRITNQVRTRVAFRCATRHQSESIIGRGGAERIAVQGRAMALLHDRLVGLQTFWTPKEWVLPLHGRGVETGPRSVLTDLERELVQSAVEELDGEFNVDRLAERFRGRLSRNRLKDLARSWERRGWLTPAQVGTARRVTDVLVAEWEGTPREENRSDGPAGPMGSGAGRREGPAGPTAAPGDPAAAEDRSGGGVRWSGGRRPVRRADGAGPMRDARSPARIG